MAGAVKAQGALLLSPSLAQPYERGADMGLAGSGTKRRALSRAGWYCVALGAGYNGGVPAVRFAQCLKPKGLGSKRRS